MATIHFSKFVILLLHHGPWPHFQQVTYVSSFYELNILISSFYLLLQTNISQMYLPTLMKFLIATLPKKNTPHLVFLRNFNKEISRIHVLNMWKNFVIDMRYNLNALLKDFTCLKVSCAVTNNIIYILKSRIRNLIC